MSLNRIDTIIITWWYNEVCLQLISALAFTNMVKKFGPIIYYVICTIEGVWILVSAISTYTALDVNLNNPLAITQLGAISIIGMFVLVFIFMGILELRSLCDHFSPTKALLNRPAILIWIIGLSTTGITGIYFLGHSLLQLFDLQSMIPLWQLCFIWGFLVLLQLIVLANLQYGRSYWRDALNEVKTKPHTEQIQRRLTPQNIGFALLIISFLIGLTKVYFGRFVDEAETITFGWLISQGDVLYRDIFSHHFPFPYYWVAMVVSFFGNSFISIRISVLMLQVSLFAASMRITKFYLAIAMTSIAWNLINQFHRGQEAIYATFEGILMSVVLILILWIIVQRPIVKVRVLVLIGGLLGLALLTDPLMIYPVSIALLGLLISGINYPKGERWKAGLRHVLFPVLSAALLIGAYGLYLYNSDTFLAFYRETIWFNSEIYSKYVDASPNRVGVLSQNLFSGIKILDSRWYEQLSPFIHLEPYRSVKLDNENQYSSWIFSGFLFRISILICSLGLVLNRKVMAGIFLYVYSGSLLVREDDGLYAIAFTMVSLFAAFYLLFELRKPAHLYETRENQTSKSSPLLRMLRAGWVILLIMIGGMHLWSAGKGGYFIVDNPRAFANSNHVWQYIKFGRDVRELGCNAENLELGVYPINPIVHFVTGIPPVSKYVWMYAWVAEIGQDELIGELKDNPAAVVWIRVERGAGSPDGVAAYMADTIKFLDEVYPIVLNNAIWMSPELAEKCPIVPGETPFTVPVEEGL